jgi:deoxycytidylate deaminase
LYCPVHERTRDLLSKGLSNSEAEELIEQDEYESADFGQRFRDTFHLADVFIATSASEGRIDTTRRQLRRFLDLLFGTRIITPTKDEYAMRIAQAAALRSSSLARQVGASILTDDGDVLSVGTNEVPGFGGGSYWEEDLTGTPDPERRDARDHKRGVDSNEEMQRILMAEVLKELEPDWKQLTNEQQNDKLDRACRKLKESGARIMNLTEFGRAVHAEMSALMSAARVGISMKDATLFTTTFPCHGCTKHIIDAGIRRVVFIEPYPKSLAGEFHSDAISIEDLDSTDKIPFVPFLGVAPRRYDDVFSMRTVEGRETRRKNAAGKLDETPIGLRLTMQPLTYIDREALAAKLLGENMKGSKLEPEG